MSGMFRGILRALSVRFTPTGALTSTDVQNAIAEEDTRVTTLNTANVKITGNQTIAGNKSFTNTISGTVNGSNRAMYLNNSNFAIHPGEILRAEGNTGEYVIIDLFGRCTISNLSTPLIFSPSVFTIDASELTVGCAGEEKLNLSYIDAVGGAVNLSLKTRASDSFQYETARFVGDFADSTLSSRKGRFTGRVYDVATARNWIVVTANATFGTDISLAPSGGQINLGANAIASTSGQLQASQFKLSALNSAPVNSSDTGTLGEIKIDANYIYICTATNTWKRTALTAW